ncbi:MAG TPA: DUF2628 domain-containing protein [Bauldia sp.]|nr:DUF2628 domain-containing protein [Bauldia sp.]
MAVYTVLAPQPMDGGTLPPDPMTLVFVKEGFSWPAFLFAGPWLIFRRLWLVLIGYVIVAVALGAAGNALGNPIFGLVMLAVHFLFALEATALRAWTLERHGYRLVGIAEGRREEEAEIRYFTEIEAQPQAAAGATPQPPQPPVPPTPPAPYSPPSVPRMSRPPSAEAGDVVGLFPAPGGGPGHTP